MDIILDHTRTESRQTKWSINTQTNGVATCTKESTNAMESKRNTRGNEKESKRERVREMTTNTIIVNEGRERKGREDERWIYVYVCSEIKRMHE